MHVPFFRVEYILKRIFHTKQMVLISATIASLDSFQKNNGVFRLEENSPFSDTYMFFCLT